MVDNIIGKNMLLDQVNSQFNDTVEKGVSKFDENRESFDNFAIGNSMVTSPVQKSTHKKNNKS